MPIEDQTVRESIQLPPESILPREEVTLQKIVPSEEEEDSDTGFRSEGRKTYRVEIVVQDIGKGEIPFLLISGKSGHGKTVFADQLHKVLHEAHPKSLHFWLNFSSAQADPLQRENSSFDPLNMSSDQMRKQLGTEGIIYLYLDDVDRDLEALQSDSSYISRLLEGREQERRGESGGSAREMIPGRLQTDMANTVETASVFAGESTKAALFQEIVRSGCPIQFIATSNFSIGLKKNNNIISQLLLRQDSITVATLAEFTIEEVKTYFKERGLNTFLSSLPSLPKQEYDLFSTVLKQITEPITLRYVSDVLLSVPEEERIQVFKSTFLSKGATSNARLFTDAMEWFYNRLDTDQQKIVRALSVLADRQFGERTPYGSGGMDVSRILSTVASLNLDMGHEALKKLHGLSGKNNHANPWISNRLSHPVFRHDIVRDTLYALPGETTQVIFDSQWTEQERLLSHERAAIYFLYAANQLGQDDVLKAEYYAASAWHWIRADKPERAILAQPTATPPSSVAPIESATTVFLPIGRFSPLLILRQELETALLKRDDALYRNLLAQNRAELGDLLYNGFNLDDNMNVLEEVKEGYENPGKRNVKGHKNFRAYLTVRFLLIVNEFENVSNRAQFAEKLLIVRGLRDSLLGLIEKLDKLGDAEEYEGVVAYTSEEKVLLKAHLRGMLGTLHNRLADWSNAERAYVTAKSDLDSDRIQPASDTASRNAVVDRLRIISNHSRTLFLKAGPQEAAARDYATNVVSEPLGYQQLWKQATQYNTVSDFLDFYYDKIADGQWCRSPEYSYALVNLAYYQLAQRDFAAVIRTIERTYEYRNEQKYKEVFNRPEQLHGLLTPDDKINHLLFRCNDPWITAYAVAVEASLRMYRDNDFITANRFFTVCADDFLEQGYSRDVGMMKLNAAFARVAARLHTAATSGEVMADSIEPLTEVIRETAVSVNDEPIAVGAVHYVLKYLADNQSSLFPEAQPSWDEWRRWIQGYLDTYNVQMNPNPNITQDAFVTATETRFINLMYPNGKEGIFVPPVVMRGALDMRPRPRFQGD